MAFPESWGDNINFTENVYISRIPVRTSEQAETFIIKLINYETAKKSQAWERSMVTAGVKITEKTLNGRSDTDVHGDIFYEEYISPNWDGSRIRYYDTGTDFEGDSNYDVNIVNTQEILSSNSMFFNMTAHGSTNVWQLENPPVNNFYFTHINSLKTPSIPIITTIACETNKFDYKDGPCLSESFIRSPKNDVVIYWGSSTSGWDSGNLKILGPSHQYEGEFYRYLFGKEIQDKNYGRLVGIARMAFLSNCKNDSRYRSLQMALNAVGDAEMPIYTDIPTEFKDVEIKYNPDSRTVKIITGVKNTRISLISLGDHGEEYHEIINDTQTGSFYMVPAYFLITLTKQNYKPYIYMVNNTETDIIEGRAEYTLNGPIFIGNKIEQKDNRNSAITFCNINKSLGTIQIAINQSDDSSSIIEMRDIFGNSATYPIDTKNTVKIDISDNAHGLYIITLITNGEIVESQKITL